MGRRREQRSCPCGSGAYDTCCGLLHRGERQAGTPEQLMRSRYSAFAVGDEAYLLASWHPRTRPADVPVDPARRWLRLEVLDAPPAGLFDAAAVVEFRAHSTVGGRPEVLRERSRFLRESGAWRYLGPA